VGNVSSLAPTIQPMIGIAPASVSLHPPEFQKIAATEKSLHRLLDAAKAMAMTDADLLADPRALAGARAEFQKSK
jgi:hypothetical protein